LRYAPLARLIETLRAVDLGKRRTIERQYAMGRYCSGKRDFVRQGGGKSQRSSQD
jgi:hypothetical protein